MITKYTMATIGLLLVIAAGAATVTAQSGYDLFQKALAAERADGNLQQAIQLYSRVVKEFGRDRALAAKALLRMAECFEKLGDAESRALYERVVREYADQPDAVSIARARVNQRLVPVRGERVVWGPGREVDLFGTISPDGRYLTYVDHSGNGNVVLRDLQTGADRPLTPNTSPAQYGWADWSAISRSGEQVAYIWFPPAPAESGYELRIAGLDGQGVPAFRRLLQGNGREGLRPFDWSPDGNWIALLIEREDRSSQIAVVNTRSGDLRVLKSIDWRGVGKIVFSPDSRYIGYDLLEGEGVRTQRVLVMAIDGSREVALTSDSGKNHVMGWAADGRLLFASDRSGTMALWTVRVEDGRSAGAPTLIKSEIASTWSLGLTRNGALYIWKPAGPAYVSTAPIDLANGELGRSGGSVNFVESRGRPAWSADGRDLLYVSCGPGGGPCRILLRNNQTGLSREVPHRLGYAHFPRLSPDGSTILTDGTDLKGRRGTYLIDVTDGDTTFVADHLTHGWSWPEWSSDGRAIHYFNQRPDEFVLLRRAIGSDTDTEVFRTSACGIGFGRVRFPLSPDGRFIACAAHDRNTNTTTLMVVPLGGTPQAVMRANAPDLFFPSRWTPDGQALLVRKVVPAGVDELWLAPVAGPARRLNIDIRNWNDDSFDLSPDGRQIAFVASAGVIGAEVWALENFLPPIAEGSR